MKELHLNNTDINKHLIGRQGHCTDKLSIVTMSQSCTIRDNISCYELQSDMTEMSSHFGSVIQYEGMAATYCMSIGDFVSFKDVKGNVIDR